MMNINMMQTEFSGSNLEAITIYVYPKFFWITADHSLTGISSQIKVDRANRNITQLGI